MDLLTFWAKIESINNGPFQGYGKIKSVNLKPGYGFVDFEDLRDAEDAVRVSDFLSDLFHADFKCSTVTFLVGSGWKTNVW